MRRHDGIDTIVQQWARERPDLDSAGFEIVGRILVLAEHLRRRVGDALEPLGLSLWAFDVLATLRRHGAPFRMTPTELTRATMLTSGAMTNRLDRLEKEGWVLREKNPDDRRGVYVVLTDVGRELVDRGIAVRMHEAREAITTFSSDERPELIGLLRRLLIEMEEGDPADP